MHQKYLHTRYMIIIYMPHCIHVLWTESCGQQDCWGLFWRHSRACIDIGIWSKLPIKLMTFSQAYCIAKTYFSIELKYIYMYLPGKWTWSVLRTLLLAFYSPYSLEHWCIGRRPIGFIWDIHGKAQMFQMYIHANPSMIILQLIY